MAEILKGAPVAAAIDKRSEELLRRLKELGTEPALAIVRVGEKDSDLSYERSAMKKCLAVGVKIKNIVLPEDISEKDYLDRLNELNEDKDVHGILLLRPLPKSIDDDKARETLLPSKDVDGCTAGSLAGVMSGEEMGFAPCTAQAITEILDHYGIDCSGKRVAVVGRSLVVGRPVSLMLLHKNATVTICHTKTENMAEITKNSDIVILCAGRMETFGAEYFSADTAVIDAGIAFNEIKGKLCGDCIFEEVEPVVSAITPVPGGVGAVTSSVLINHVLQAAWR